MSNQATEILDYPLATIRLEDLKTDEDLTNTLYQKGYKTIGDIYNLQPEGISLIADVEFERAEAFWRQVLDVVSNPEDWTLQIPDALQGVGQAEITSLPQMLRPSIEKFFADSDNSRLYTILVRRFGLNDSKVYTLEQIGTYFGITRERIRQLQNDGIQLLQNALTPSNAVQLSLDETASPFSLEMLHEIQAIQRHFEEGAIVRIEQDMFQFLSNRYQIQLDKDMKAYWGLLFIVFGWDYVDTARFDIRPFWIIRPDEFDLREFWIAAKKILKVIKNECLKISYFDLKIAVNRRSNHSDFILRTAIKICPDIEVLDNDYFQIAFHKLPTQDQTYRVLAEHGEPLNHRDIHREIARRLANVGERIPSNRTTSNALVHDKRFITIGKSGTWALSEWDDVVQGTIVDIMKEFFHRHNQPAREKEIYEYVRQKRPVSRKSITAYLNTENFVRVARGLYQPVEWRIPENSQNVSNENRWTKERVAKLVVSIFDNNHTEVLPMSQLVNQVCNVMNIPAGSSNIYQTLHQCPAVKISVLSERPRRLEARLIRDYEIRRPQTLRDRLEATIREILMNQPEQTMQLVELRNKVTKRGNIHPHTFYQYLSDMPDIQKNVVDGTRQVLVTLINIGEDTSSVPDVWDSKFIYDIAISYAGAERKIASSLADNLRSQNLRVFYDRKQLPDLIGRNLLDELMIIYRDQARLCIILASKEYNKSDFAQHERQSAQDRALKDKGYIFLVKLDDVEQIKGFHSTVAYVDWNEYGLEEISGLAIEQLRKRNK